MRKYLFPLFAILAILVTACRGPATTEAPPAPTQPPAVAPTEAPAVEVGPIKIGFFGPLTGGAAFLGQEQLNFAKVAVEVFNAETGLNVELVEGDTKIDPDEGKIVAERFVADPDIYAVVGPSGSQVCEATQPVFQEAGLAHITPSCTRVSLTDPGTPTFFRPIPHDGDQGPTDARYMVDVLEATSAYLVDDQSSYSVGLTDEVAAALGELGVTAVERASVTQEDTDFSSLVTAILVANPDVVFFPGQISSQLGTLAVQLREQGYSGTYFLGDGGFDISWVEVAGDAAEGTYLSFFAPDPHFIPQAEPYTSRYQQEYGDFGAFGGPSALAARIALEAIKRCVDDGSLSRACVVDEIAATNMTDSLLGVPIKFGAGNQLEGGEFFIFQVQQGEFALIQGDQPGVAAVAAECDVDLTGEKVVLYQQAGREGPVAAILGQAFVFATADAVGEINDAGGICGAELVVEFRETNYNVELEVQAYEEERVADPKPFAIQTYASGATVALHERVIEDHIVNFAAGVNAEAIYIPRDGWTVGVVPIYSDQFAGFLKWVNDNWEDVKPAGAGDDIVVGVIGWANAYGAGATTPEAVAYAESLGITVLPLEEQPISPDADVTGQIQNLLVQGANVIYQQNLSFSTAQVVGTVRALGAWDQVVMGGVNWSGNTDVLNFLGENAGLMEGFYTITPHVTWDETDHPGIRRATAAFQRGGAPGSERTNTYLLTYAGFFNLKQILEHAINRDGFPVTGDTFFDAFKDLGTVNALGIFEYSAKGEDRAPRMAQISQLQNVDGKLRYVVVEEWFELPDTRPPAPASN